MRLWTVWLDYYATGEGRTQMAFIGHAENEQNALDLFGEEFGEYFMLGAEALIGVIQNRVTEALFTPQAMQRTRDLEGQGTLLLTARWHVNLA